MDVPLELKDIGIRHGFKGYKRKSSTFSPKTDVVGLSAFIDIWAQGGYFALVNVIKE